jgi:hypothetical protein
MISGGMGDFVSISGSGATASESETDAAGHATFAVQITGAAAQRQVQVRSGAIRR